MVNAQIPNKSRFDLDTRQSLERGQVLGDG
jgi:hypothetical protein